MPLTQKDILLYIKDHGGTVSVIDLLNFYIGSGQFNEANTLIKSAIRRGYINASDKINLPLSRVSVTPSGEDWLADTLQRETELDEIRRQLKSYQHKSNVRYIITTSISAAAIIVSALIAIFK